jgi:WD40 repeat protein/DNA-binding SARP family transcriptional activator
MTVTHRLHLFGRVVLEQAEQPAWRFPTRKSIALLGYLARQSHSVPRGELTNLLWGNLPDARSRRNLTRELSQLSAQLPNCFQSDYHNIRWAPPASIWVDTNAFLELLAPAAAPARTPALPKPAPSDPWFDRPGAATADSARLAAAVELYGGEFMAGLYLDDCPDFETWLTREREYWRRLVMDQLELLIAHHALRQQDVQAIVFARRCLELEPWHEAAHCALMVLLARGGKRAAALAQYETCRGMLIAELALEPAPETTALYEQIRANQLQIVDFRLQKEPDNLQSTIYNLQLHNSIGVPEVQRFYGREAELATLQRWVVDERCRVISVLGMGGIGKTQLAARLAHAVAGQMDVVVWRSLLNAPPLDTLLRGIVAALADEPPADVLADLDQQLALLIDLLRRRRCLLVLDNVESIFQPGARAGAYREDFAAYEQLLHVVAAHSHQSCLLLTSREQPQGVRLQADNPLVQSLRLGGLGTSACRQILHGRLDESLERADALIERYSGNPLALTLVAETIHEIFAGDVHAFLRDDTLIFDDIRDVLDQQWERLTPIERDVLLWLAVEREAITPNQLQHDLIGDLRRPALLEALRSLVRRSLVQSEGSGFTLQNVVMEYVTARLIDQVCAEIARGGAERFNTHALIKAQAKHYVRASQARLILQPIAARLIASLGRAQLEQRLLQILRTQQAAAPRTPGYAGGNTLNMLLHLSYDLRGYDFSHLAIWQADLSGAWLPNMNFSGADLTGSVFTDTVQEVQPVAFSPDDTLLAVGTSAGEIRLWRTADWQLVDVMTSDGGVIWTLCFSPDSKQFATGTVDGRVRVWDVDLRRIRHILSGHTQPVGWVDWSADGTKIVSAGGWDHTVRLWNARSGAALGTFTGHTGFVSHVELSPDSTLVASSDWDGQIYLWDAQTRQVIRTLSCGAQVTQIGFNHDGTLLAGAIDRSVWVWDIATGELISTLEHLGAEVRYLVCSPTDDLAAIGVDRIVSLRDLRTGHVVQTLQGHTDRIRAFAWRHDGAALATWADETVRVWDSSSGQTLAIMRGFTPAVYSVAISADGAHLVGGCANGRIHVWDARTWQLCYMLDGHLGIVTWIAFSPDRITFASASTDHSIRIWRVGSEQPLQTWHAHDDAVTAVAFSPDGRMLASASEDCTLRLWDVATGRLRHELRGHSASVLCVAWSPDGRLLASSGADRMVRLWDAGVGGSLAVLTDHRELVRSVTFDPSGQLVTSAAVDGIARIWNIQTAAVTEILLQTALGVTQIAYSPDGSLLLAYGYTETVYVWDVARGQLQHSLDGHAGWVQGVAWLPDGARFVSASHDGTLRVWDALSGANVHILRVPGPYDGMNITGAMGITEAQRVALKALGAQDEL